jgi:adenine-specific DNA-methyltransferase
MQLDTIRDKLGKPAYEDSDILLYQGDSIELMSHLNGVFDLTVTSPPYNIGKEYESVRPLYDYIKWSRTWLSLVHRCTSDRGALWLNLGYISLDGRAKAIPLPYLLWNVIPFYLIQEIVWNYGAGVAGRLFFSPRNEKFLWYVKDPANYVFNLDDVRDPDVKYPNQKKNGKLKCNPLGKNPSDVWQIAKVTSGESRSSTERTAHPAQFPIAVVSRIILASSNIGDIVFDPFVGSGSTIEAAIRSKRRIVAVEINKTYIDTAMKRIRSVRRDIDMAGRQSPLPFGEHLERHEL